MVRALPSNTRTPLDVSRILAISTAIALHALAFLLLILPMAYKAPTVEQSIRDPWIIPMQPVKPVVPVTPLAKPVTPQVVPVQRQTQTLPPETTTPVTASPVDNGTLAATVENTVSEPTIVAETVTTQPLSGMQLQYLAAPAPAYPINELRNGVGGTVLLRVLVGIDGMPVEVSIEKSSGSRALDMAARAQVLKRWKFRPATHQGQVVQAYGLVPIDFSVQR